LSRTLAQTGQLFWGPEKADEKEKDGPERLPRALFCFFSAGGLSADFFLESALSEPPSADAPLPPLLEEYGPMS